MTTSTTRWQVFPDAAALADQSAGLILAVAREAIAARQVFHLVLTGGRTPEQTYGRLRACAADWSKWQIYFGDERCVPRDHADRNDAMARRAWLDHVPIPKVNIHSMPAELGPDPGAQRYAELMQRAPEFDLVLFGLGEDGHVASLFPGRPTGQGARDPDAIGVRASPKPPPERVSLSLARLNRAQRALFLVAGSGKREAVRRWRSGADIPAQRIQASQGVDVHVDVAAWPEG